MEVAQKYLQDIDLRETENVDEVRLREEGALATVLYLLSSVEEQCG